MAMKFAQFIVTLLAVAQISPYAGMTGRPIKRVCPDQNEVPRGGKGMGLAMAAELNGYPGPRHVLESADAIGITGEQRVRIQASYDLMLGGAKRIGDEIVNEEQ